MTTHKYYSSGKCLHVCLWKIKYTFHICMCKRLEGKSCGAGVQVNLGECVYFNEMKCERMMGWRVDERGREEGGGRRKERSSPVALGASLPWGPSDCSVTIHRRLTLP